MARSHPRPKTWPIGTVTSLGAHWHPLGVGVAGEAGLGLIRSAQAIGFLVCSRLQGIAGVERLES
jgi:hypothetical protein